MKTIALLSLFCGLVIAQTTQVTPPSSRTRGPCSPIVPGNGNTVTVTCQGVDRALAEQIVGLVIASKKDDKLLREILDKVSALRKSLESAQSTTIITTGPQSPVTTGPNSPVTINPEINPNADVVTYDCPGNVRSSAEGLHLGANEVPFEKMRTLFNQHKYDDLIRTCTEQIQATPGWLTPHLFCAWAYGAKNDTARAKAELATFDAKKGPAYDIGECKQVSDALHQNLR